MCGELAHNMVMAWLMQFLRDYTENSRRQLLKRGLKIIIDDECFRRLKLTDNVRDDHGILSI